MVDLVSSSRAANQKDKPKMLICKLIKEKKLEEFIEKQNEEIEDLKLMLKETKLKLEGMKMT